MIDTGTWHLATKRAEFLDLQSDWDRIFHENARHSPFLSWGWVDAWLRHIARVHELRIIYWRDAGGITQYILPLHRPRNRFGFGSGSTMLVCSYGLDSSDNLGCLCVPELEDQSSELTADAIDYFFDRSDSISLRFLDSTGSFPWRLQEAMQSSGRKIKIRPDSTCPTAVLPASWDEFLRQLSSNFRSQVRRSYKQVGGDGQPKFRFVDPTESESFATELIRLNRSRIRAKGRTSSLESDGFRNFLSEVIPYLASQGISWMDTIERDGEVLGAALNFVHGDTVYFYMGGFDDKASKIRPGTALFALVIQRGIERGHSRYDFLRGDELYKYRWSATDVMMHSVAIYPRGFLRAHLASAADDIYLTARKFLRYARRQIRGRD